MNLTQKEALREAILAGLAAQPTKSFTVSRLYRVLFREAPDLDAAESDVAEAIAFLEGFGHVAPHDGPLGASLYWRATSHGVLAHERSSR